MRGGRQGWAALTGGGVAIHSHWGTRGTPARDVGFGDRGRAPKCTTLEPMTSRRLAPEARSSLRAAGTTAFLAVAFLVSSCTAAKGCFVDKQDQTEYPAPDRRRLSGPVVAVAADGACIVQRGTHVDVFGADLARPKRLPMGDTSGQPGVWYAVSSGTRYVARVDRTGWIELWDVAAARRAARLEPGAHLPQVFEMPLVGPAHQTAASWGPPAFLGDDLLVTHHNQGIILWEVPSGRARCTLQDPAIRLAREAFALGRGVAAVRSGSDSPGIHNAVVIEFSTRDCSVRERHLVPARDPVVAAASGSARFIFSLKGIRATDESSNVQALVSDVPVSPHAMHASHDGRWVVWAGADTTKAAEEVVGLWSREGNRMIPVARLQQSSRILHLRIEGAAVHALDSSGQVFTWPLPAAGNGEPVRSSVVSADQLAREKAILHLGLGEPQLALREFERVVASEARTSNRFLQAYAQSLVEREDGNVFRARMARDSIRYAGDSATLAAAEDLTSAEVLGPALDMFLYWLEGARPGSRPESAVQLGLELVLQLSESDDHETKALLLRRLREIYPTDVQIAEQLKDLEEESQE